MKPRRDLWPWRGVGFLGQMVAAVVRDGLGLYPFQGANPPDLDKIFTDDLAGVEFYAQAALAPAELGDASAWRPRALEPVTK